MKGKRRIGHDDRINLSDNGPELARFHEIEEWGAKEFFANPYRSTDKASCERNHEFIRYVIPKGPPDRVRRPGCCNHSVK